MVTDGSNQEENMEIRVIEISNEKADLFQEKTSTQRNV